MIGRQSLRIVMVLGVLITLVGGTGIFAVFTDRATTGFNTVGSGARPHAADLQISEASNTGGALNCDPDGDALFSDDLTTGLFSVADVQPGGQTPSRWICLLNAGSGPLAISASVIDLQDEDEGCTGDEEAAGDTTCGGFQAGELGALLDLEVTEVPCLDPNAPGIGSTGSLATFADEPIRGGGGSFPAGSTTCVRLRVSYPGATPETSVQLAQSDRVQWRFAFDGTVVE